MQDTQLNQSKFLFKFQWINSDIKCPIKLSQHSTVIWQQNYWNIGITLLNFIQADFFPSMCKSWLADHTKSWAALQKSCYWLFYLFDQSLPCFALLIGKAKTVWDGSTDQIDYATRV